MTAYYNEHDPNAAAWLRELIRQGHIAPGVVDERSIEDVLPVDLADYTQCHFFAGIGVWSYALRQAGWPDDRPVWTGSCPCQPFSAAGKGGGFADERHLWPAWFWLIGQRRPPVIFGEQVASRDGLAWLDLVQSDMEGTGYAIGTVDLCAAGLGAPHRRQRLFFVADASSARLPEQRRERHKHARLATNSQSGSGNMANTSSQGLPVCECQELPGTQRDNERRTIEQYRCSSGDVGDTSVGTQRAFNRQSGSGRETQQSDRGPSVLNGFWRDAEWLWCRDEKYRPVEPGTFPLAHGAPARVGRLRGYGNAIVAPVAIEFIRAFLQIEQGNHE